MKRFLPVLLASIAFSGFAIDKNRAESQISPSLLAPSAICIRKEGEPQGPNRWSLDASFLIWQSKEWGLEFAEKSYQATSLGTSQVFSDEKSFVPDFAWRAGLKVELGSSLPYDGWDLKARWIYYHGQFTNLKRTFDSVITPNGVGIVPLWFYPFYSFSSAQEVRYSYASSNWKLYFNSLDLELGRCMLLLVPVSLRFDVGIKGAWLRQQLHVEYSGGNSVTVVIPGTSGTSTLQLQTSGLSFKSDAWALGPRLGFSTRWPLIYGFGLMSEWAFSLMYEFFDTHRQQMDDSINQGTNTLEQRQMTLEDSFSRAAPVTEAMLGLEWADCFYPKGHPCSVRCILAYEAQYWWAQNGFGRNYQVLAPAQRMDARGDLQMHGLTASLGVEF